MTHPPSRSVLANAVRDFLRNRHAWDHRLTFVDVEEVGDRLLVVVRREPNREEKLGVYYQLSDYPKGPNTGELCATPDEWAQEIAWDLDEFVGAGGSMAQRSPGPGDVTVLSWDTT